MSSGGRVGGNFHEVKVYLDTVRFDVPVYGQKHRLRIQIKANDAQCFCNHLQSKYETNISIVLVSYLSKAALHMHIFTVCTVKLARKLLIKHNWNVNLRITC